MRDVILVLNAGSSSVKFCVFDADAGSLATIMRGQVEGLYTSPRFAARDAQGAQIATREWDEGVEFGHDAAVAWLVEFLSGADAAGIVLGARVPIILTSRADAMLTRLASCAVAAMLAKARRESAQVVE